MSNVKLYELLRTKNIISILDGDKKMGEYKFDDNTMVTISMPYLSGPKLCNISTSFGLPVNYEWNGGSLSRWQYLNNLIEYCINNNRFSDLLSYLFNKNQFSEMLVGHCAADVDKVYNEIKRRVIQEINGELFFGDHEMMVVGNQFIIREISNDVEVQVPKIKTIPNREYIKSISSRAIQDVELGNFDSAITKSRTLLEETFCYVIENKNIVPSCSGNISELYRQVKSLYNMHADIETDKRINMLLSGLEKIIKAISQMRNKDSDAHGVGAARINIAVYHARLFVNTSMTVADFILAVAMNNKAEV